MTSGKYGTNVSKSCATVHGHARANVPDVKPTNTVKGMDCTCATNTAANSFAAIWKCCKPIKPVSHKHYHSATIAGNHTRKICIRITDKRRHIFIHSNICIMPRLNTNFTAKHVFHICYRLLSWYKAIVSTFYAIFAAEIQALPEGCKVASICLNNNHQYTYL